MIRIDIQKARSLLSAAKRDYEFTLTITPSPQSSATIIRNVYESFRMLGEAKLALSGIKSADHSMQIQELIRLPVDTKRPLQALQEIKRIRHSINYDGYEPRVTQAEDALDIARACFLSCYELIIQEIQS